MFGIRVPEYFKLTNAVYAGLLALLFVASSLGAASVRAYNNVNNPTCLWTYGGVGGLYLAESDGSTISYQTAFANAKASWNATSRPVVFVASGSPSSTWGDDFIAGSLLGITTDCTYPRTVTLNRNYLDPDASYYATPFWRQYTAAHELGHDISLGHSTAATTIMSAVAAPADSPPRIQRAPS